MKALVVLLILSLSCGGDDGTCSDPSLPNCGLQGHTVVKWMFDHYPEWQFDSDSCSDFGIATVHVDAIDAVGTVTSGDDQCGVGQVTLDGLPAGQYTVYAAPRDINGTDLVTAPATATVMAGTYGDDQTVTVDVPWTSWIGTFTGTFLFRLSWGGQSCALATPPIVKQVLTLAVNGTVTTLLDRRRPASRRDRSRSLLRAGGELPAVGDDATVRPRDADRRRPRRLERGPVPSRVRYVRRRGDHEPHDHIRRADARRRHVITGSSRSCRSRAHRHPGR